MRITLDIDTDHLTDSDKRVLAAIIHGDSVPLVLPRELSQDLFTPAPPNSAAPTPADHTPVAGLPSPTPAPAAFMERVGQAVGQFASAGSQHEARLPFAQQAGVRTRSTMPTDDESADGVEANRAALVESSAVSVDPEPGAVNRDDHAGTSPVEQRTIRTAHGLTPRLVQTDPPVRHTTP